MIRKLLATTAVAALIAGGISTTNAQDNQSTTPGVNDVSGFAIFIQSDTMTPRTDEDGYLEAQGNEILSSNLMGKPVYSGPGADADEIGNVNDVLLAPNGIAQAVVIGVGGFLGIGEKEVAIDFNRVNWSEEENGERRLVVATTSEELDSAPAFDRSKIIPYGAADMQMSQANTNADATLNPNGVQTDAETSMGADSEVAANDTVANDLAANDTVADNEQAAGMDNTTTASVDSSIDPTTLGADDLIGTSVFDGNGDNMGEISDVIISTNSEQIEAYIVDVGGFLGIGEKPVALDTSSLQVTRDGNGSLSVHTGLTQEQLEAGPTYSEDAYMSDPNAVLVR